MSGNSNTATVTTLSPPPADTTAPSAPTGLAGTAASASRIDLAWTASTDNVQVAGYRIFRNGVQIGTSSSTSYAATGLAAGTTYNFIVRAYDAAGNVSANSATASATTLAPPPPPPGGGIVDDGAAGNRVTSGWNMGFGRGYMGDVHIAPKGTGSRSATWTFTGLANGQYNVWVTFTANGKNATNAPFSIHNGNSGKTPVVKVNQRFAPTQAAAGFKWRYLTKVNVVNGWAMVKLTNNANGNVIADAVRLVRAPAAAPLPAALPASAVATSVIDAKPPLSARTFLAFASAAHSQGQSTSSVQQTAPPAESPAPGAAHDQVFGGGSDVGPESALLEEAVNLLSDLHGSGSKDDSSTLAIDEVLASSAD